MIVGIQGWGSELPFILLLSSVVVAEKIVAEKWIHLNESHTCWLEKIQSWMIETRWVMELNSSSGAAIQIYCMNETIESKTNYQLHVLKKSFILQDSFFLNSIYWRYHFSTMIMNKILCLSFVNSIQDNFQIKNGKLLIF